MWICGMGCWVWAALQGRQLVLKQLSWLKPRFRWGLCKSLTQRDELPFLRHPLNQPRWRRWRCWRRGRRWRRGRGDPVVEEQEDCQAPSSNSPLSRYLHFIQIIDPHKTFQPNAKKVVTAPEKNPHGPWESTCSSRPPSPARRRRSATQEEREEKEGSAWNGTVGGDKSFVKGFTNSASRVSRGAVSGSLWSTRSSRCRAGRGGGEGGEAAGGGEEQGGLELSESL